jgi:hypothetical protein
MRNVLITIMNLYLLSHVTYRDAHRAFLTTPMSIIAVVGIDIVIEQDEHDKFVGSLLIITQRSYGPLISARVGVRQLARISARIFPLRQLSHRLIRILMSPKEGR